jgi:hypothetical protein
MPGQGKGEDDSPIPTAASRWKKKTLDLLNVKYERTYIIPFDFAGLASGRNAEAYDLLY